MKHAAGLALAILVLCPDLAQAYVDPGSGSMLLQLLLGGVAGVVVLLRLYWQRLLQLLGLRRGADEPEPPLPAPPTTPQHPGTPTDVQRQS